MPGSVPSRVRARRPAFVVALVLVLLDAAVAAFVTVTRHDDGADASHGPVRHGRLLPQLRLRNYGSALLPSADGGEVLEIATDYDRGTCRSFYATNTADPS